MEIYEFDMVQSAPDSFDVVPFNAEYVQLRRIRQLFPEV